MARPGARQLRCFTCGYSLAGLDRSITTACPECGKWINWRLVLRFGRAKTPIASSILLIVLPHLVVIVVGLFAFVARRAFDGGPEKILLAVVLLSWPASPACAIIGLHRLFRGRNRSSDSSRALATIWGLVVGIGLMPATLLVCYALGSLLGAW